MRLRELKYPIAVLQPWCLMGGKNAHLSLSSRFNVNLADYFQRGGYDEALIYDSDGNEYEVLTVELHPLSLQSKVGMYFNFGLGLIVGAVFRLFGRRYEEADLGDVAWVDMILKKRRKLSLQEFSDELRSIVLAHPEWWRRHSKKSEIESLFRGSSSFAEAIHEIGVLDPSGKEKLPGKSSKVVDLR